MNPDTQKCFVAYAKGTLTRIGDASLKVARREVQGRLNLHNNGRLVLGENTLTICKAIIAECEKRGI